MIPLTAEQIAVLVAARDLLQRMGSHPKTGGGLAGGVADGISLILKVSLVSEVSAVDDISSPLLPSLDEIRESATLPGKPFRPKGFDGYPDDHMAQDEKLIEEFEHDPNIGSV